MITISLCMIVKNEEAVLPRILEPMKTVADEILIADTGSTDQTKALALQYTPLVFDFPWVQDFSAARNFICSKASMDYWMWLDADDVISPRWLAELLTLKHTLNPSTDMVMMKYVTNFDEKNKPVFSYYRERLIKNRCGYRWSGKVHEAVTPSGTVLHSPIEIEHRKLTAGDPDRNLNIYEMMLQNGEILEPRHQFYYGQELYYHKRYEEAARIFIAFLKEPGGWIENQIDACMQLSYCYDQLGREEESIHALFHSFSLDIPRAEICCEIGRHLLNRQLYRLAAYWYQQAIAAKPDETAGSFVRQDCHDYIPYIQLCVCYDRLGNHQKAWEYHLRSMVLKPYAREVRANQRYFEKLLGITSDASGPA